MQTKYKRKTLTEQQQLEAVKQYGYAIRYIHNPSQEIVNYMLENYKELFLKYFEVEIQDIIETKYKRKTLTEQQQLEAVKQYGYDIQYIHDPSEEVQLEAVKNNGHAIQYIHNPSEEVKLEAVKQYGYAIQYIHNPSEEVQLEAVKQYGYAIRYIHNPSEQVIEYMLQNRKEFFLKYFE